VTRTTLLMTSSVYVAAPIVAVNDAEERARLTLDSVEKWLKSTDRIRIVLCDGSGYDFSEACAERFPSAAIECLNFKNDEVAVAKYGKGYGEGEIMKHALTNSENLRGADFFVKCTSKLWVNNFDQIMRRWNGIFQCDYMFRNPGSVRNIEPELIDTRFYVVNRDFYVRNLQESYRNVRDLEGYWLEHSFKDAIASKGLKASRFYFPVLPEVAGVSGSTGRVYRPDVSTRRQRIERLKKKVRLRINELFFNSVPVSRNT